jgi:subtilisin family serine protease
VSVLVAVALAIPAAPSLAEPQAPDAVAADSTRVLVRFDQAATAATVAAAEQLAGAGHSEPLPELDLRAIEVGPGEAADTVEALERLAGVAWAEPDPPTRADALYPATPLWTAQWGPAKIRAPEAWGVTTGASSVVVAVLDTGVDAGHPDLADAVLPGRDLVAGDDDATDEHGHGTAAASIIAATGATGSGLAGLCWSCSVLPVRVLDARGTGTVSGLAEGIRWAVDRGADVINMSLSSDAPSRALDEAVSYAAARGVVLAASAGNDGTTAQHWPAAYPSVLGIAASDESDARTPYSTHGCWVQLAAPGRNLAATAAARDPVRGYREFNGTSSAAPIVAGVAGLALAVRPGITGPEVERALLAGAVDVGGFVAGGRVDAAAALAALDGGTTPALPAGVRRYSGCSRYDTAASVATSSFKAPVPRVYIATGAAAADALAAGPAAAQLGASVLLTDAASLPPATAMQLRRLRPAEIVVVGGPNAVGDGLLDQLSVFAPVRRLFGSDRYATAAAIARDAFPGSVRVVYVASGAGFADALAGGPAAARDGAPLLLTAGDALPDTTAAALSALQPERIVLLGGTGVVGEEVATQLGRYADRMDRIAGDDRFATAAAVAERVFPGPVAAAFVATGGNFPDALAGGPAAARNGGPLLLSGAERLSQASAEQLRRLRPQAIGVLGGNAALSDGVLADARSALASR